ncbi:hypothetical protein PHISP_00692 [Aspergillus sp. HF37]|nr:hypothetical protein PHISP_00692 [Aspergillus sp. HF37]
MFNPLRVASRLPLRSVRWNSTETPGPPLMAQIRSDLKAAMKAKDASRLDVLRALISEYNNQAKSPKPLRSDIDLLKVIRKRVAAAEIAAQEFSAANRSDLKEKQDSQVAILNEYAGQVKTLSREEIREAVAQEIANMNGEGKKANIGVLLSRLFAHEGALCNKAETWEAAQVIKEFLSAS